MIPLSPSPHLIAYKRKMKLKRDHGYTQQNRLKHERAMNKYTGNSEEKILQQIWYQRNLLDYQEITNQFDFESQLTAKRVTKRR